jgi:hypothetical protein
MSELARAMHLIGNLGLNVMRYPSGKYGFVGRVPSDLAYIKEDGTTPTEDECKEVAQASFRAMVCKRLGIKTRVFETEQAARDAAKSAGYSICN